MTKKKATIILEGNTRKQERMIHELVKIVDEASQEPELTATIQTMEIPESDHEPHFEQGDTSGP